MSDTDPQAVFDAGCTSEELRDTVTICALFNFYNRLIEGYGVKGCADLFT
jgi:alkylhydroperoxidase family enzyme